MFLKSENDFRFFPKIYAGTKSAAKEITLPGKPEWMKYEKIIKQMLDRIASERGVYFLLNGIPLTVKSTKLFAKIAKS